MNDDIKPISVNANKLHIVQEPHIHRVMTRPAEPDTLAKVQEISEAFLATVKLLVDRPDDVTVTIMPTVDGPVLQLCVHATDMGKVIGKQGRMARALRILLGAINASAKLHLSLDIVDK